jgi:methyl-CpG-binding domain protein 4
MGGGFQWTRPEQLHGIGQYGADAYDIFCRGDWRAVAPKDKDLLRYHRWLLETDGLGSGLARDAAPQLSADAAEAASA